MSILTRKRLLLASSESTYATSSAPSGTDALLVSGLDVEPLKLTLADRALLRGYLGNSDQVVTEQSVGVKFEVEIAGSGTAGTAPKWGPIMKACGFSETIVASTSVTYAPVSTSFSSVTLDFRNDGQKHLIVGARGTASFSMKTGEVPKISFEMMGLYATPTATANPSVTYTNQSVPLAVNSDNTPTVSVHSFSGCLESFSLNVANEMVFRQLAGCTKQIIIPDRKPAGDITIELPSVATKDFYSLAIAQTQAAISVVHGITAGNIVTVTANNSALGTPKLVDGNGIQHITLPFRPIPTAAGNDEITLVLT